MSYDYIPRFNNLIDYIDNNIYEDLNIDILADMVYFSKFHFCRLFKKYTGESIYSYIKRLRIERSFYLLWNSDESIKIIADKCGFNSASHFSHNFKKYFGISASEQREKNIEFKEEDFSKVSPNIDVNVKTVEPKTLAYIKSFGSYEMDTLPIEKKLYSWAHSRGYWKNDSRFTRMNYNSVHVTKEQFFQSNICVEVPPGTTGFENIAILETPERMVATLNVTGTASKELLLGPLGDLNNWILLSGFKHAIISPGLISHKKRSISNIKDRYNEILNFQISQPVEYK